MRLTDDQKRAVGCDENVMLTACPGSGKTRVIISKLIRAIDTVRDTPRAVGCITYTNAAVYEIEGRLSAYIRPGDERYYDVCTIHSFCLNHVFRHFCYLIKGYTNGFKVLTPESNEFEEHVRRVWQKFGKHTLYQTDFEDFSQLGVDTEGRPTGQAISRGGLTPEVATEYWKQIRQAGYIDFANIIYYSLMLLKAQPDVRACVSSKFAWILVDEFQDTTDLQVEILALIAKTGRSRFLLVGDPYQSIFRFAGARPDLAQEFSGRIHARTDLNLSGNFRSSPPILEHAERLCPRIPAMDAVGTASVFTETPVARHGSTTVEVITKYFLPAIQSLSIPLGDAAILAPSWYPLFPLGRQLRRLGVSIVGPGARPYRRRSQFAPLAEQVCGYLMEPAPEAIPAIERALFTTLLDITGRAYFDIFSYSGRRVVFRLVTSARGLHASVTSAAEWLEAAATDFSQILAEEGYMGQAARDVFSNSVKEMITDMIKNKVDVDSLTIADLGIYATPNAALKLSSIHNAKGREYAAVALIDLHEDRIPHSSSESADDIAEQRRLFYVGITRARRYLMYVTTDCGKPPSRFLWVGTGIGLYRAPARRSR